MKGGASVSVSDFATTLPKPATPRQSQINHLIIRQIILILCLSNPAYRA